MKHTVILFLLLFSQITCLKAADDFSMKEKSIIYTNAVKVIANYGSILNTIGESAVTDMEKARSSSESFLELFVNRQVLLFNDLDPAHRLSEFYEAETYASNLILWYPDGIAVTLDLANAKVSEILNHEENVYSIDVLVTKSINGNYLNETLNKNTEELTFRIAFGIQDKDFTNFRIVGVRNAASNVVVDYSKALREVNSEDLNHEDLVKIYGEIKSVLADYTNFLSLLGDPQEAAEDKEFYKESFRKLFRTDTRVFNDIMPDPETKLLPVENYLALYLANYPDGIKNLQINIDSARFGKVMKQDDGRYYTFVDANKFFSGTYRGKDAFRQMSPLIFRVSFSESGRTFSDFTINSIDLASVNFYQDTPEGTLERKPGLVISPVTRKGWTLSFVASGGLTGINNKNLESLSKPVDAVEWMTQTRYGFTGAFGAAYYFNDHLAVKTGLEFDRYAGKYILSGTYTDNVLSADDNNTSFFKVVEAEYDSIVTLNYITVPALFNFTSGKPGNTAFYAEGGLKLSIPFSGRFSSKGDYRYYGDYPSAPLGNRYVYIPEKGFYDKSGDNSINNSDNIRLRNVNVSLHASAGISIPIGYYTSVMVGPELTIGLSDIMRNNRSYTDVFGKAYTHLPTRINNFGLKITFAYKL
ncbi:MAG: outer membrane beta-barrel protein [Methanosarcina sp.]